jgi:large subunit ribosomal protein L5
MAKEDKKSQKGAAEKGGAKAEKPVQQQAKAKREPKQQAAVQVESGPRVPAPPARLSQFYREKVVPDLVKKFGYKTSMQAPRITKITVNMGVGETVGDKKILDNAVGDMTRITGQKPVVTKARKSIANFKLRAGFPIGCMVTLRGARMYEFLDRLVNIAIPRIRDFRGISSRAFDGRGNYSLGVREQIIFPEIEYDKIDAIRGLNIAITTTARTDDEAKALLSAFRFPFKT